MIQNVDDKRKSSILNMEPAIIMPIEVVYVNGGIYAMSSIEHKLHSYV